MRTGRPKRKDNPKRITVLLSAKHIRMLERIAATAPSRGYAIERLIESAAQGEK
jgi:hypothetical protein